MTYYVLHAADLAEFDTREQALGFINELVASGWAQDSIRLIEGQEHTLVAIQKVEVAE